ncbi:unnamed protein product [Nezara viridula]|uniref:Pyridine nucleotide-disulphide oxidoreductase dimerisation domain-containing protein n=1 Tax=Nezara viridula TaxID=85310 RepID=A0A9P0H348_NEZVI|nr:unnamed protein product [Nezara viridula]
MENDSQQKDGDNDKYSKKPVNIRQHKNIKTNKRLGKKRRFSRPPSELDLQQIFPQPLEDGLRYGVIPLDGRAQLEYQLDQKLKKIREEAISFSELLEDLKQYAILSKIVKLCKFQERYRRKRSKQKIKVKAQLFPDHSVYKVKGKYQNSVHDDFIENFNTIIIAGKRMCPSQDVNIHDIGVTTCPFNGKIYTNFLDQTTVPTVYGIGDCVYGWPYENYSSVIAAQYLVRRLFSDFEETPEVQLGISTVQTYPLQYAFVGLSEEQARSTYRKVVTYIGSYKPKPNLWLANDDISATLKFVCYEEAPEMEKVVGIHFYHEQAPDTIQGYAAGMKTGIYYKEVRDLVATIPVHMECACQLNMDRKEYENLEIEELPHIDIYESNSQSNSISLYAETETESSSDEYKLYIPESVSSDKHDSSESSTEDTSIENEETDTSEYYSEETSEEETSEEQTSEEQTFEEEIQEEEEEIQEEEEEIQEEEEEVQEEEEIQEIHEEEEIHSNSSELEEEGLDEEESFESYVSGAMQIEQIIETVHSVEDSAIHSHSDSAALTAITSVTRFVSTFSTPEEESSYAQDYVLPDLSTIDDSNPFSLIVEKTVAEKQSSASEETSSELFQTATGNNSASVIVSEHASLEQKQLEICDKESDNSSVQSLKESQSSANSKCSTLSGRILDLDAPDVYVHFEDKASADEIRDYKKTELGEWSSSCPYGSALQLQMLRAAQLRDPNQKPRKSPWLALLSLDSGIRNQIKKCHSDPNKHVRSQKHHKINKTSRKQSMNLKRSDNPPVQRPIGESEEERKSNYSLGKVDKEIERTSSKFDRSQFTDLFKRKYKSWKIFQPPTSKEKTNTSPINLYTNLCYSTFTDEGLSDSISTLYSSTSTASTESEKSKDPPRRFISYPIIHVRETSLSNSKEKQGNIDSKVQIKSAKGTSDNRKAMISDPVTTISSIILDSSDSREFIQNASTKVEESPKNPPTSAVTRSACDRWLFFDSLVEREKSKIKKN